MNGKVDMIRKYLVLKGLLTLAAPSVYPIGIPLFPACHYIFSYIVFKSRFLAKKHAKLL